MTRFYPKTGCSNFLLLSLVLLFLFLVLSPSLSTSPSLSAQNNDLADDPEPVLTEDDIRHQQQTADEAAAAAAEQELEEDEEEMGMAVEDEDGDGPAGDGEDDDEMAEEEEDDGDSPSPFAEDGDVEGMGMETDLSSSPPPPYFSPDSFPAAFLSSFSMILVSELGDKTFFIAAILAMKQARMTIFASAIAALALMTVLSAGMGRALPALLPVRWTRLAATVLFIFFGFKLLYDAWGMVAGEPNEELEEVEEELKEKEMESRDNSMESGGLLSSNRPSPPSSPAASASSPPSSYTSNILSSKLFSSLKKGYTVLSKRTWSHLLRFFSPLFIQCFTMTFLAEWGDRSQIATIALAAAKDPVGVTMGGILGHSICTGIAVIGGKLLATKISEKTVSYVGGFLFLGFAVHSVMGEGV